MCPVYRMLAGKPASIPQITHITLSSTPDQQLENHSTKYHRQQPLYNTLELLMMGIVVPETCWASNKVCNKKPLLHVAGILFPHINNDARSKSHQIWTRILQEHLTTRQIPWKALACSTLINHRRKLSHKLRHTFLLLADLRRNCICRWVWHWPYE